jgi:nitrogen regulatory protein P-II 2
MTRIRLGIVSRVATPIDAALECRKISVFAAMLRGLTSVIMNLIVAIIQPHRLESVKRALGQVDVVRLTIMDCQGCGPQQGKSEQYGADEFAMNFQRKVQLQIAVNEEFVEPTISAIEFGGRSGDRKIFVLPLDDCIRIRTGERGPAAI